MCLQTLHTKEEKEKLKIIKENGHNVGWRVFKKRHSRMYSLYKGNRKFFRVGTWMKEFDHRDHGLKCPNNFIHMNPRETYSLGFHIFLKEKDATKYMHRFGVSQRSPTMRKVYFKKVVATGRQNYYDCIVAKEIFIVPLR